MRIYCYLLLFTSITSSTNYTYVRVKC